MSDPVAMMTVVSLLTGIWLGIHFGVIVLIPILMIGALSVAFCTFGTEISFHEIMILCGMPLIAVQCGYMVGLTGHDMIAQIRNRFDTSQSERI
jgi:hypothetical protein